MEYIEDHVVAQKTVKIITDSVVLVKGEAEKKPTKKAAAKKAEAGAEAEAKPAKKPAAKKAEPKE
jgi:hypothetical protein